MNFASADLIGTPIAVENKSPAIVQDKTLTRFQDEINIYETAASNPLPAFPTMGKLLQAGDNDDLVFLLRQHLKASHDLTMSAPDTTVFDADLRRAVENFQWRHGLDVDGVVGNDTRMELNIMPEERIRQLRLNMQRWSQINSKLGHRFLLVNIPEYQLHLIDSGQEVLTMKVIVGKPERPTPELSSTISRIIFNPYWNVPNLIAQKDIIPKVIQDPDFLINNQIRILDNHENNARELSSSDVDWQNASENGFPYRFRQDPGMHNALGLVKFEFQNSHNVFLHDTPSKSLFANDDRDLSSGCIRLEKPFELVSYFIQNDERIDEEKVKERLDTEKISSLKVKVPLPIFIVYMTNWVDKNDVVHFGKDIYWQDSENPQLAQVEQE